MNSKEDKLKEIQIQTHYNQTVEWLFKTKRRNSSFTREPQ